MDTAMDMATDMATVDIMDMDTTMARGLLMLSLLPLLMLNPPLQLMLMPGMDMAMDTMDTDTTMARGLLMLSLLPGMDMDMVVMVITDMVIMVMDMVMAMDTTVESKTLSWLGVTQVV